MLTSLHERQEAFDEPQKSLGLKLIAGICAVAVTAAVFLGYALLRKRHAQQNLANASQALTSSSTSKGPPKVHILVDDALLKGSQTIIGGSVRNISHEKLGELSVELELRRRKDGAAEMRSVPLEPPQLEPEKEGRYSLVLQAQDYGSVRLVGLKTGGDSTLLTYTSGPGQRRPPERFEPKTAQRSSSGRDEFLNSPDKPARVP